MDTSRTNAGITLVEVLVVISIIVVLLIGVALLFPASGEAHALPDVIQCKNTQRCLVLTCMTYAESWKGEYPKLSAARTPPATPMEATRAFGLLLSLKYITNKRAFQCRYDLGDESLINDTGITSCAGTSYGYDPTHMIKDPSDVAILADSTPNCIPEDSKSCHGAITGSGDAALGKWVITFVDAHVELVTSPVLSTGDNVFVYNTNRAPELESWIRGGKHDP